MLALGHFKSQCKLKICFFHQCPLAIWRTSFAVLVTWEIKYYSNWIDPKCFPYLYTLFLTQLVCWPHLSATYLDLSPIPHAAWTPCPPWPWPVHCVNWNSPALTFAWLITLIVLSYCTMLGFIGCCYGIILRSLYKGERIYTRGATRLHSTVYPNTKSETTQGIHTFYRVGLVSYRTSFKSLWWRNHLFRKRWV